MLRGAELDLRLRRSGAAIPLVVLRLPAIERLAWRAGRAQARRLEARAVEAFLALAKRVLRGGDLLAHDAASDAFLAALAARRRGGAAEPSPLDVRSALARLAGGMERALASPVVGGWTLHGGRAEPDEVTAVVERAVRCGEEERTRFAFFSAIGHELRTPLAAVRGYVETALDERDAGARDRFLAIAHRETLRLCRLVDGMFEISLLDLHRASAPGGRASLRRIIEAVADGCAASARACGVEVRFAPAPDVEVGAVADHVVLALLNVVENAVKHGRSGGRVEIRVRAQRRAAAIVVDDDGPGIPAASRARIFAAGERGRSAAPGSGLGLATARLVVERNGGRITVGASPAGGARFVVTLPRVTRRPTA